MSGPGALRADPAHMNDDDLQLRHRLRKSTSTVFKQERWDAPMRLRRNSFSLAIGQSINAALSFLYAEKSESLPILGKKEMSKIYFEKENAV